jgi:prepilin-type N-terminal cleavage/methylation domain-containing protein
MGLKMKDNDHGFSLIEVLIAIAIFSIALFGISTMLISSTKSAAKARKITESSSLAADRIETLLATDYDDLVSSPADIEEGAYSISWVVTDDAPINNVKTIVVRVENAQNNPRNFEFEYYKAIEF